MNINGGMQILEYKSKVSKGNPVSLRTTIPKEVSKFLDIEVGDSVIWEVEITSEGTRISIKKNK